MNEWWTYRAEDFLMFSPRIYTRLFELVNTAWWPWHLLLGAAGLAGLVALARGRGWWACGVGLGAAWLLCAVVFVHGRYLPINWAVAGLLPALLLLALLLPVLGWRAGLQVGSAGCEAGADRSGHGHPSGPRARAVALALGTWALLLHPLLAPWAGQGWRQAEVFGLAPDPTAVATLALLVALPRLPTCGWRGTVALAWLLVLAWCAFSGFMLAAMGSLNALVLAVAAMLAAGCALSRWVQRPKAGGIDEAGALAAPAGGGKARP